MSESFGLNVYSEALDDATMDVPIEAGGQTGSHSLKWPVTINEGIVSSEWWTQPNRKRDTAECVGNQWNIIGGTKAAN